MSSRAHTSRILRKRWHELLLDEHIRLDSVQKKPLPIPPALFPQEKIPLEWWYFTGHLEDKKQKKRLGYEFCFFKFHPQAIHFGPFHLSRLKKKPFLVFHQALTDKSLSIFKYTQDSGLIHEEKIDYGHLQLRLNRAELSFRKNFHLKSRNSLGELELQLHPLKKIVKNFDHGYARMFSRPESRTYYLTCPRLHTTGRITLGKKKYQVFGLSWFDHQKMNLPRHSPLEGWDWFSIILDDNTELMFFVVKSRKGVIFRGGSYVDKNSQVYSIKKKDVRLRVLEYWTSPQTKIIYPSGWELSFPKLKLNLTLIPELKDQELEQTKYSVISYWEGACQVEGQKAGKRIKGQAYVELVGYDQRLQTKILKKLVN